MADPFEIPHTMHELAEQKVKQAHAAYDQITAHVTSAMSAWMGTIPSNPMTAGLKDAHDRAIEIAKQNAEFSFHACRQDRQGKDPPRGFDASDAVCSRPGARVRQSDAGFWRLIKKLQRG